MNNTPYIITLKDGKGRAVGGYVLLNPDMLPEPDLRDGNVSSYDAFREQMLLERIELAATVHCDMNKLVDEWNRKEHRPSRGQLFTRYANFMALRRRYRAHCRQSQVRRVMVVARVPLAVAAAM